ncbi:hypothetical protein K1719_000960 [Acacia pycnantha]|nr:hypothetical protein K1719_000960 [Acacia pycnantha]
MRPFRRTLVVKLLGRQPSYNFMVKKLKQLWERKGKIDVFDLENDFFLVSFQLMEDYMEALTGGPWVVMDAYLNVARWRPEFCPKNEKIESVVAWVRLPDLPAPLFDKKFLLNLGNAIGKAIRLDIHTAQRARGKFARLCVELDLTKPLIPEFRVENQTLSIVYESLGLLCNKCGWFGHNKASHLEFHKKKAEVEMEVESAEANQSNGQCNDGDKDLWKTVQRVRRQRRAPLPWQNHQNGSRFSVLDVDPGGEGTSLGVDKGHVSVGQGVGDEKVQREEHQRLRQRKGPQDTRREANRGSEVRAANDRGVSEMEGRKEKVGKERTAMVTNKNKDVGVGSSDPLKVHNSTECVPVGNLELYKWHGVKRAGKENLNPGDPCLIAQGKTSMANRDSQMFETGKVLIEPVETSMEEGVLAPRVTDARGQASSILRRKEAEGFSGNRILWNLDDLLVDVVIFGRTIYSFQSVMSGTKMCLTTVYASPNELRRHRTWDMLLTLSQEINDPWLLVGILTILKHPWSKKGVGESVKLDAGGLTTGFKTLV